MENLIKELERISSDTLFQTRIKNAREKFQMALKSNSTDFNGWDQWSEWHDFGNWNDSNLTQKAVVSMPVACFEPHNLFSDWTEWTEWGDTF